jgi:hypothetical protein
MIKLFLCASIIVICSCENSTGKLKSVNNQSVLYKKETCSIFEELVLIETHLQNTYFSFENYKEALFVSRDSLLKSKNVTLEQFNKSFDHYAKSDKEMTALYEEILNDLNENAAKTSTKN